MEKQNKTLEQLDRDKFLALDILAKTEGGKVITSSLLKDITSTIDNLASRYKDATHIELLRLCADLNAKLSLYRALTRAGKHKEMIDDIIAEALNTDD
jgi:hypothetical protein